MPVTRSRLVLFLGVVCASMSTTGWSAPVVSGISGTVADGQQLRITGSGFGQKSPAKPFLWAPFENSIAPSPLGRKTAWDTVEDTFYAAGEGYAGTGALKGGASGYANGGIVWTAGVNTTGFGFAWNDYSQKMYLFRREKRNFNIDNTMNWKALRLWSANQTYPNWYIATSNGSWNCEGIAEINSYPYGSYGDSVSLSRPTPGIVAARQGNGAWRTDQYIVQANSSASSADGLWEHYVLGYGLAARIPFRDYMTHNFKIKDSSASGSAAMVMAFPAHGVLDTGYNPPAGWMIWYDDIYLDNTWARVMVGNAPKLADSTYVSIQIPSSWSDAEVGVTLNLRGIPDGEPRYLFVIDSNNSESTGYLISDGTAPLPPSNVVVD